MELVSPLAPQVVTPSHVMSPGPPGQLYLRLVLFRRSIDLGVQ